MIGDRAQTACRILWRCRQVCVYRPHEGKNLNSRKLDLTIQFGVSAIDCQNVNIWPCPIDRDFIFKWNFVKFVGYENRHKISAKFDIGPDKTIDFGVTCLERIKIPIDLYWR